ncbi:MAG: hypothetical protein ACXWF8_04335 [Methylobacter sp.]
MKKNFGRKLLFLACLSGLGLAGQAYAATYYVSSSGSDSNSGSQSSPFKTINKGLSRATSSGDIVYVMSGTYPEMVYVGQSGIKLLAYPNNTPVIDGQGWLPNKDWGSLISVAGNNNTVSGFEVKNSNTNGSHQGGFGVSVTGHHNLMTKMNVHHAWEQGVIVQGDYNTVEDSSVWQSSRHNSTNPGKVTWGTGMSAARNKSSAALKYGITSYATFRRNKVYNNWGEGLSCFEADHCTMEDNVVYDNWATNMYLSDATNSLVQRNMIYVSSSPAISSHSVTAFTLSDEVSSAPRSKNNTVVNNFIYNAKFDAFSWTLVSNSGLNNVLIANNTIVDGSLNTGNGGSPSIVNTNSQIRNNIIAGKGSYIPSNNGITFSDNNWIATPPSAASASSNIIADPHLARSGSTAPGALTSAFFKIASSSPVINAAMPLSNVTTDFFKVNRGSSPDMGGHEYQ